MILNEIFISTCFVNSLMGISALLAIGVLVVSFLLAWIFERCSWGGLWRMIERNLHLGFSLVWFAGFCIYCVGMYIVPEDVSLDFWRLVQVMPMAIIHAFEMFLLESEASAIHATFHENWYFMMLFSYVHLLAALVSLAFVLKHFGYNMVASARLKFAASCFAKNPDILYIFWGMNEANYLLADSVNKKHQNETTNYKILFVKTSDEDDNQNNRTGLNRLFNFFSVKNKELDKLKSLECLSAHSFRMLSKCKLTEEEKHRGTKILDEKLGLKSIVKLIKKTTGNIYVFMLSEEESTNLRASSNLCCDSDIKSFISKNKKFHIYCHARRDSVNSVAEDSLSGNNIEVHIVDSSRFSINELKSDINNHPIKFVDLDTEDNYGTVKSDFKSLIVGFGETGRDAARFLYEFSAFTSSKSSKEDDVPKGNNENISVIPSGFACYVTDTKMNQIKGRFLSSAPALADKNSGFDFYNYDVNSEDFLILLCNISSKLNYVVVALGNDEQSITTAIRIFNYVRSHRKNLDKFKIFVKCKETSPESFVQNIENHFNEVNANKEGCENAKKHIQIFGTYKSIYTYSQIIENDFEKEGVEYNHKYCEVSGKNGIKDVWDSRHNELLKSHKLDNYSELRRKEFQDVQNAYHALTKIYIMQEICKANPNETRLTFKCLSGDSDCVPLFKRKMINKNELSGIISASNAGVSDVEQLMFRNIARMEHLRWNASHRILGYNNYSAIKDEEIIEVIGEDVHKCNERFKIHNCLIDWRELDAESLEAVNEEENYYPDYKLYDFITISTSLKLRSEQISKNNQHFFVTLQKILS